MELLIFSKIVKNLDIDKQSKSRLRKLKIEQIIGDSSKDEKRLKILKTDILS